MGVNIKLLSLLSLVSSGTAHFFLQLPDSIGFSDNEMDQGPCDGFDPKTRDGPVTDWPVNGHPVSLISTHQDVVWHVDAALLSDTSNFVPIVKPFRQTGVGEICFESIPGKESWIGEDVVISIYQVTNHGDLFQCIAAVFTEGPAADVPSSCVNFDGVEHEPIVAAPDSGDGGGSSSTTSASVTSKTSTTEGGSETTSAPAGDSQTTADTPAPTGGDHDHGDDDGDDDSEGEHNHGSGKDDGADGEDGGEDGHDHEHGDDDSADEHDHGSDKPEEENPEDDKPEDDKPEDDGAEHDHGNGGEDAPVAPPTPTDDDGASETPIVTAGAAIFGVDNGVYMMGAAIAAGLAAF